MERRLTVQGTLDRATTSLAAAGVIAPRREAIRLVADLLGWSPAEVALGGRRVIEPDRRRWVDRAVARRAKGEPLAYVTGLAGFRHLVLRCDRRGLIPRPETEGVVDRALRLAPTGVAVDVGTGTGCLALALRQEGRYRRVVAIDRSPEAIALAALNRHRTGLAIDLVRGDLVDGLAADSIDLVVSNPPYLTTAEYLALDPGVRDYEPRLALESGEDGLAATRRLLEGAGGVIRPGGWLVMEVAADRAEATARLAGATGWSRVGIDHDLFGRPRYLVARREG